MECKQVNSTVPDQTAPLEDLDLHCSDLTD